MRSKLATFLFASLLLHYHSLCIIIGGNFGAISLVGMGNEVENRNISEYPTGEVIIKEVDSTVMEDLGTRQNR